MAKYNLIGVENNNNSNKCARGSKRAMSTIDINHRNNHDGYLYSIPFFKTVSSSSYAVLWLESSSTKLEIHLYLNYSADNAGYLDIWKGAVSATSQWVSIIPVNANGWSTNAAQVTAYSGGVPSTSTATLLHIESVGSGGKQTGGGTGGLINEIIMTPASTYAIRFVCTSTEADVSFSINFYEEDVEG